MSITFIVLSVDIISKLRIHKHMKLAENIYKRDKTDNQTTLMKILK